MVDYDIEIKKYPDPQQATRLLCIRHGLPQEQVNSAITEATWTQGKWIHVDGTNNLFSVKLEGRLWIVRIRSNPRYSGRSKSKGKGKPPA